MFPRVRTSGVISVGYCLATVDLDKGSYCKHCNCNTPVIRDSSKYFPFTWLPSDIRNWIRNIEQHASDNVNKILVGNKADMEESKRVGALKVNPMFSGVCDWTITSVLHKIRCSCWDSLYQFSSTCVC
jgi:hypothetical protein